MLFLQNIPQDNCKEDVKKVIKRFMTEKMQIVNADSLEIARAHRFGKLRKDKTRPTLVRFEKFKATSYEEWNESSRNKIRRE